LIIFQIFDTDDGNELTMIMLSWWCVITWQERQLLGALHITERTMINYLTLLEQHYRPTVAYHNSIHAADVTQTSHVMLLAPALEVSNMTSRTNCTDNCNLLRRSDG